MRTARWNWIVLVVSGCIVLLFGVLGELVKAVYLETPPLGYLILGVGFVVAGLAVRRSYRRYEADVMATAAKELDAESRESDA